MAKAIDIVLLPDEPLQSLVLRLNSEAFARGQSAIQLNLEDRLPHLSLLMGIMADDQKNNIIVELEKIAANFQAIPLEFKEFRDYSLEFVNSIELQKLHEAVTTMIDPFLTHEVAPEMYNETQGTELDPSIFSWVEHFQDRHSFKNFQPHITIGQSSDTAVVIPTYSTASTLALCHLGNFNTCRTILWSTKLINHSL